MIYFTYILTNWNNKVMYIGMTNNLERRLYEHRNKLIDGFTEKYNVYKLVYYESTDDVNAAIAREKQLKGWLRAKKNALVETMNPEWRDLYDNLKLNARFQTSISRHYSKKADSVKVISKCPRHT